MVFHGYRSVGGTHHILGRETCLAPVSWPENGWPVVNGNGTATINMTCPTLTLKPFVAKSERTDFSSETVGGFTGLYVGLYATGNGKACSANADYGWFEYIKNESGMENTGSRGF